MNTDETLIDLVDQFLQKFDIGYTGPPRDLPVSIAHLRIAIMQEELDELKIALQRGEFEQQLDALVDMTYVLLGTVILCGYKHVFYEAFTRVHAANMQKIKANTYADSKRNSKHDIIKPVGWRAPNLSDLVEGVKQ